MKHDTPQAHKRARAWRLSGEIRAAAAAYRTGQIDEQELRRIWRDASREFVALFGKPPPNRF